MDMAGVALAAGLVLLMVGIALLINNGAKGAATPTVTMGNVSGAVNFGNAGRDIHQSVGGSAAVAPNTNQRWRVILGSILSAIGSAASIWGVWLVFHPPSLPGVG